MNTGQESGYWCPHGRLSIQRLSTGGNPIEIVPGGAFNAVVLGNVGYGDGGGVYLPSRCTPQCVHYRRRLWRWRRGRCALESQSLYGPALLLAVALLVAVLGNRLCP